MTMKALHDMLLALKPEDVEHECALCQEDFVEIASHPGGTVSDKTYTEEQYNALAAQVEELKAQIAGFQAAAASDEVDAKVAEAKAEAAEQIAKIQADLDAAVLKASVAEEALANTVAYLEATAAEQAEKAEREARKDERLAALKEVANFPEDFLSENADRFAGMDDETWEATLAGFKAQKAALESATPETEPGIPVTQALVASRSQSEISPLQMIKAVHADGQDLRTVR